MNYWIGNTVRQALVWLPLATFFLWREPRGARRISLVGAFALSVCLGGWIVWTGSYAEYMQRGFLGIALPLGSVALVSSWVVRTGMIPTTFMVGSAFPLVIYIRVWMDVVKYSTSHNLWPFEVVVVGVLGFAVAFVASRIGVLLQRITNALVNP